MSFADLPVRPPVAPMLAKLARELPSGEYIYEPKWDGFRCIVFRSGSEVELGSRNELPLTRYFPELVAALSQVLPQRAVLDGEVVVAGPTGLDFDALSQRVHPAESRVRLLAERTPASFVAFDLLALDDRDLRKEPFHERRRLLENVIGEAGPSVGVYLTPATRDRSLAEDWFGRFEGAGLDGVVAKAADLAYVAGKRVMVKVKHERTAEFVVGGFRWYRASADSGTPGQSEIGSLMLGLYDSAGDLSHVGVIGAFAAEQRRQLVEVLAPYRVGSDGGLEGHPWSGWATATEAGPRLPGPEPLERNERPQLRAAPSRLGGRSCLRAPAGHASAPYRSVQALAPRPRCAELHLRPARRRRADGAGRRFRRVQASGVRRARDRHRGPDGEKY